MTTKAAVNQRLAILLVSCLCVSVAYAGIGGGGPRSKDEALPARVITGADLEIHEKALNDKQLYFLDQEEALLDIFEFCNGKFWIQKDAWSTRKHVCRWNGIRCDDAAHVIEIVLDKNNLRCSQLPHSIANLQYLEKLWLPGNSIGGTLPPEIGELQHLKHIWLSQNKIVGTIPTEFGLLSNLEYLWLSNNAIIGQIPFELSELKTLRNVDLHANALSGELHPSLVASLSHLRKLDISDNMFTGRVPEEFVDWKSNNIDLEDNPFTHLPYAIRASKYGRKFNSWNPVYLSSKPGVSDIVFRGSFMSINGGETVHESLRPGERIHFVVTFRPNARPALTVHTGKGEESSEDVKAADHEDHVPLKVFKKKGSFDSDPGNSAKASPMMVRGRFSSESPELLMYVFGKSATACPSYVDAVRVAGQTIREQGDDADSFDVDAFVLRTVGLEDTTHDAIEAVISAATYSSYAHAKIAAEERGIGYGQCDSKELACDDVLYFPHIQSPALDPELPMCGYLVVENAETNRESIDFSISFERTVLGRMTRSSSF